jgi:hypothetical protein
VAGIESLQDISADVWQAAQPKGSSQIHPRGLIRFFRSSLQQNFKVKSTLIIFILPYT